MGQSWVRSWGSDLGGNLPSVSLLRGIVDKLRGLQILRFFDPTEGAGSDERYENDTGLVKGPRQMAVGCHALIQRHKRRVDVEFEQPVRVDFL